MLKGKIKNPTHGCGRHLFFLVIPEGILSEFLVFLVAQVESPVFVPWAAAAARAVRAQVSPGVAQGAVGLLVKVRGKYHSSVGRNSLESSCL